MGTSAIGDRLKNLRRQLNAFPETKEPPQTTLQVINRSRREGDWQNLLVYFLTPTEPHGLDTDLIEHVLVNLDERGDLDFSFSQLDLEEIQIEQEVGTGQGRPDLVLWSPHNWFIVWELKIDADETEGQTSRYVQTDSFEAIDVEKEDYHESGQHYIYLAPSSVSRPQSDEFVVVSWEWLAAVLQSFVSGTYGEYPTRTTAQLNDFIDTIRHELRMTEFEKNQQARAELFIEYANDIAEVQEAFDNIWYQFKNEWIHDLAEQLEMNGIISDMQVIDDYVSITLPNLGQRWILKNDGDWHWLFRDGWWRDITTGEVIYEPRDVDARIGFAHRLDNKEDIIHDNKLVFLLRNHRQSNEPFFEAFDEVAKARSDEILKTAPDTCEIEGRAKITKAKYDINYSGDGGIKEAYTETLEKAFVDHAVHHTEFCSIIDEIYKETFEKVRG